MENGENAVDAGLNVKQKVGRVMKVSVDAVLSEMVKRFERLNDLDSKYGFILDVKELISRRRKSQPNV